MGLVYDHSANFGHTRKRKPKVKRKTDAQYLREAGTMCLECRMHNGAHWHWCKTGKVPE